MGIDVNAIDIFFTAKILVMCLRIVLSTTLFLEDVQPRVALQPINPLVELN